ncbi:hypothetical protein SPI_05602 [Niveomyces insectorum RCEF 264]|uniref:Uncharacterized protein n=1 Tax=Niveomyces insectorum RCEF 264 TaxID=1081102 RepID=A0A167TD52_9HYPO|nr:hypothetical protein SPI_05602 [Niveomyces insectorum RCEF 264]
MAREAMEGGPSKDGKTANDELGQRAFPQGPWADARAPTPTGRYTVNLGQHLAVLFAWRLSGRVSLNRLS